jgi:hypothetical protein
LLSEDVPVTLTVTPADGPYIDPLAGEVIATLGGVVSLLVATVTYCTALAELPEESVAVQVTLVVPTGNPPDGASLLTTGEGSTISVTVAFPRDTCVRVPPEDTVDTSGGAVIDGG